MDDLKPLVYTIFIVIYLLYRVFRGAKKMQQQPGQSPPVQPPVEKEPESLFETIRREIKKQQQLTETKQEAKPTAAAPEKKPLKVSPKKTTRASVLNEGGNVPMIDEIQKEGARASSEKTRKERVLIQQEEEQSSDFDPREAFMMKTLLDRRFEM